MKLQVLYLVAFAAVADVVCGTKNCTTSANQLTVRTSTGTFTGLIDPKFPHTRQFRAIPFAEPPVGPRRFLPPKKLPPLPNEHHYAIKFPPSCSQFVSAVPNFYNGNLTHGNLIYNGGQNDTSGQIGEATSEDCLYLAVWAPTEAAATLNATAADDDRRLPVLFFMTGGGFIMGGIDIPWQLPPSWVEGSRSHIVVTINYRVGILGFPNARGLANEDQNLGILDQRAALKWVYENIAAFGGDPTRITMMGRSAGAFSADIHAYAWYDDPIAQAIYMQSGTVFSQGQRPVDSTYSNFSFVARHTGCEFPMGVNGGEDITGAAELDCMRQVSAAQLYNFIGQYGDRGSHPALDFNAVPDGRTVFTLSEYKARSESGRIARIPYLISEAANEMSTLVPLPDNNMTQGPSQAVITALDVSGFVCPTFNSTVYRNRLGVDKNGNYLAPVFRMQYAGTFPNLNVYDWMGAWHASDITMFFGTYHMLDYVANTTDFEIAVSRAYQDHVLAFIQDPYHGAQRDLGWQPMNTSSPYGGDLLRIGAGGKVVQHVDGIEVDGVCLGVGEYNPFPQ